MAAMLRMKKRDICELERAAAGDAYEVTHKSSAVIEPPTGFGDGHGASAAER